MTFHKITFLRLTIRCFSWCRFTILLSAVMIKKKCVVNMGREREKRHRGYAGRKTKAPIFSKAFIIL